ncbi:hypothetical protein Aduo_011327 [Ancylostoma duodenale]
MIRSCTLLFLSLLPCDGYKFLVYTPIFGYSHANFMGAIADTLTEARHDVMVLMPVIDYEQQDKTGLKLTKKIIKVPTDPRVIDLMRYKGEALSKVWTMEPNLIGLLFQLAQNMTRAFT